MGRGLQGRVTAVTGPGRDIGLGIAERLSERGASIVISNVNEDNARNDVAEIEAMGGGTIYILADVSKHGDAQNLVGATIREVGSLDILANSAGINKDRMFRRMSADGQNAVIAVNPTGVFNHMRATVNHMRGREYGRIINISSVSYLSNNVGQANCAAARAGVAALTKTRAKENGKKSIICNTVVPGLIDTETTRGVPGKAWDIMVGKISMGYAGTPEDIGNTITFLVSDETSHITQGVFEAGGGIVL